MEFRMNIIRTSEESIVAVCDVAVVGRKFRENGRCLDVSEAFYGEDVVTEAEVKDAFRKYRNFNFTGNDIVELAIAEGLVSPDNILVVEGVKHAQAVSH